MSATTGVVANESQQFNAEDQRILDKATKELEILTELQLQSVSQELAKENKDTALFIDKFRSRFTTREILLKSREKFLLNEQRKIEQTQRKIKAEYEQIQKEEFQKERKQALDAYYQFIQQNAIKNAPIVLQPLAVAPVNPVVSAQPQAIVSSKPIAVTVNPEARIFVLGGNDLLDVDKERLQELINNPNRTFQVLRSKDVQWLDENPSITIFKSSNQFGLAKNVYKQTEILRFFSNPQQTAQYKLKNDALKAANNQLANVKQELKINFEDSGIEKQIKEGKDINPQTRSQYFQLKQNEISLNESISNLKAEIKTLLQQSSRVYSDRYFFLNDQDQIEYIATPDSQSEILMTRIQAAQAFATALLPSATASPSERDDDLRRLRQMGFLGQNAGLYGSDLQEGLMQSAADNALKLNLLLESQNKQLQDRAKLQFVSSLPIISEIKSTVAEQKITIANNQIRSAAQNALHAVQYLSNPDSVDSSIRQLHKDRLEQAWEYAPNNPQLSTFSSISNYAKQIPKDRVELLSPKSRAKLIKSSQTDELKMIRTRIEKEFQDEIRSSTSLLDRLNRLAITRRNENKPVRPSSINVPILAERGPMRNVIQTVTANQTRYDDDYVYLTGEEAIQAMQARQAIRNAEIKRNESLEFINAKEHDRVAYNLKHGIVTEGQLDYKKRVELDRLVNKSAKNETELLAFVNELKQREAKAIEDIARLEESQRRQKEITRQEIDKIGKQSEKASKRIDELLEYNRISPDEALQQRKQLVLLAKDIRNQIKNIETKQALFDKQTVDQIKVINNELTVLNARRVASEHKLLQAQNELVMRKRAVETGNIGSLVNSSITKTDQFKIISSGITVFENDETKVQQNVETTLNRLSNGGKMVVKETTTIQNPLIEKQSLDVRSTETLIQVRPMTSSRVDISIQKPSTFFSQPVQIQAKPDTTRDELEQTLKSKLIGQLSTYAEPTFKEVKQSISNAEDLKIVNKLEQFYKNLSPEIRKEFSEDITQTGIYSTPEEAQLRLKAAQEFQKGASDQAAKDVMKEKAETEFLKANPQLLQADAKLITIDESIQSNIIAILIKAGLSAVMAQTLGVRIALNVSMFFSSFGTSELLKNLVGDKISDFLIRNVGSSLLGVLTSQNMVIDSFIYLIELLGCRTGFLQSVVDKFKGIQRDFSTEEIDQIETELYGVKVFTNKTTSLSDLASGKRYYRIPQSSVQQFEKNRTEALASWGPKRMAERMFRFINTVGAETFMALLLPGSAFSTAKSLVFGIGTSYVALSKRYGIQRLLAKAGLSLDEKNWPRTSSLLERLKGFIPTTIYDTVQNFLIQGLTEAEKADLTKCANDKSLQSTARCQNLVFKQQEYLLKYQNGDTLQGLLSRAATNTSTAVMGNLLTVENINSLLTSAQPIISNGVDSILNLVGMIPKQELVNATGIIDNLAEYYDRLGKIGQNLGTPNARQHLQDLIQKAREAGVGATNLYETLVNQLKEFDQLQLEQEQKRSIQQNGYIASWKNAILSSLGLSNVLLTSYEKNDVVKNLLQSPTSLSAVNSLEKIDRILQKCAGLSPEQLKQYQEELNWALDQTKNAFKQGLILPDDAILNRFPSLKTQVEMFNEAEVDTVFSIKLKKGQVYETVKEEVNLQRLREVALMVAHPEQRKTFMQRLVAYSQPNATFTQQGMASQWKTILTALQNDQAGSLFNGVIMSTLFQYLPSWKEYIPRFDTTQIDSLAKSSIETLSRTEGGAEIANDILSQKGVETTFDKAAATFAEANTTPDLLESVQKLYESAVKDNDIEYLIDQERLTQNISSAVNRVYDSGFIARMINGGSRVFAFMRRK